MADPVNVGAHGLESASAFMAIADDRARAQAVFTEMGKVLTHPRCVNCHPVGDLPLQGEFSIPHEPLAVRGPKGEGVVGMACITCHGEDNFERVPGRANWHLAPQSMAWEGRSVAEICTQLVDRERNGNMDLPAVVEHLASDSLVGWGFAPNEHLEPAPGSQAILGDLAHAWLEAGASCPSH